VNAYDNSIVHTDALLAEITMRLGRLKAWDRTLLYVSDHGESLGEGGLYLHGTPAALAPDVQMDIPLLIWRASAGSAAPVGAWPTRREGIFGHDHVFHSVMGALGLRSGAYRAERDLFRHDAR
jgi:lipid A ethanolaminephosphotransferase